MCMHARQRATTRLLAVTCVGLMAAMQGCGQRTVAIAPSTMAAKVHTRTTHKPPRPVGWFASPQRYGATAAVYAGRLGAARAQVQAQSQVQVQVPILMYHDLDYLPGNNLGMAPGQFATEMQYLYQHGFHPINLGQLYAGLYAHSPLPAHPVVVTFDDGYASVFTKAYPILKQYRFQATTFMISGWVGLNGTFRMLSATQLKTMQQNGVIDVESHTVHHLDMGYVSSQTAQYELHKSAVTLQQIVGHPILYFCYPSGGYHSQTLSLLKKDGYLLAVTERSGYASPQDNPLELPRLRIFEGMSLPGFAALLSGPTALSRGV